MAERLHKDLNIIIEKSHEEKTADNWRSKDSMGSPAGSIGDDKLLKTAYK